MIAIVRSFGVPVTEPPGNTARRSSTKLHSGFIVDSTVLTI
jgi:hypothetical protein